MAYPTDTGVSYTSRSSGDIIQPSHVNDLQTEVAALKTKVGIDSSAVATTVDYLLKSTSSSNPGHKHTLANGASDVTATASEVNKLAGLATTAAELGYVNGVTSAIQTQLNATVKKISLSSSNTTVTGTAAETTLYTVSIPANTLSTSNGVRFRIAITDLDMTNNPTTLTIRVKYGGSTVATVSTGAITTTPSNLTGYIEGCVISAGTTSSQEGQGILFVTEAGASLFTAYGTSAVDSTASQDLVITAQFSTATGSNLVTGHIIVERIA